MNNPFQDRHSSALLDRVRDDISHLRRDISHLLRHTTRRTLPEGARSLAESARQHFSDGTHQAASTLRSLTSSQPRQTLGVLGGAVVIGVLAAGIYALVKCENERREREEG